MREGEAVTSPSALQTTAYLSAVTSPFFSIVMASYLGEYEGKYGKSATDRITKFHRAVKSALAQSFDNFELLIVADGCTDTGQEASRYLDRRVRLLDIPKQRLWSEKVRNAGIHKAKGLYVIYLDTDDELEDDHLRRIHTALQDADLPPWGYFTDQMWDEKQQAWMHRPAVVTKKGGAGTSNLVHAGAQTVYWPTITYRWPEMGYDHDWQFVNHLRANFGPGVDLGLGGYRVCHVPRKYDI